jgi:carboxypeptidase C (cathepsin A)
LANTKSGNWFGGEAISLAIEYTHSAAFAAAGYEPMVVDGTEYGEVRQYGNYSFARIYESGHEIPFYQRKSIPSKSRLLVHSVVVALFLLFW